MHKTDVAHILWGMMTAFISSVNAVLSVIMFVSYVVYQYFEYESRSDTSGDIAEYMLGLLLGVAIGMLSGVGIWELLIN